MFTNPNPFVGLVSVVPLGRIIWVLFFLVVLGAVVATLALEYHWGKYGIDAQKIILVRSLYRTGALFLLAVIFLAAIFYSLS